MPIDRAREDPYEAAATEPDLRETCAICGRELWSDGLPPAKDGNAWICGDCDAARNHEARDSQASTLRHATCRPGGMAQKHPDTPGDESAEEALNEPTRENMERLGRADLEEERDPQANEQDDSQSRPGQNSDWLPE